MQAREGSKQANPIGLSPGKLPAARLGRQFDSEIVKAFLRGELGRGGVLKQKSATVKPDLSWKRGLARTIKS